MTETRKALYVLVLLMLAGTVATKAEQVMFKIPTPVAFAATIPAEDDLAIIVNKSNPIDHLSFAELRKIFLAERGHWSNGQKITLVMRGPGQPEREAMLRLIYRMSESDFNRHFLHTTFTGQVQSAPKQLATAAGVRKFVFNVPGAIGYVRAADVDASVKVVRVDGRGPGEPGYKIRLAAR